jgi:diguanylate cyclase (GGDEF)-like protein
MDCSNELTATEFYAMKLVCTAIHYEDEALPDELQSIALEDEDAVLSDSARLDKARRLVFDTSYEDAKALIEEYISQVTEPILANTQHKQAANMKDLENAIAKDRICLSILLVTNVIIFAAIAILVVKPLHTDIKCLKNKTMLEVSGAYELRYLAVTYNHICTKNAANEAILRQKAERDALTGILNRGAFNQITTLLEDSSVPIALLLVDVDQFKSINDGYGHNTGDQVLRKVAETLTRSFRASDHIARIGGDEFAVIMTNASVEQASVIKRKAGEMNDALSHPEDGLPPISLSIGAAFSTHGYSQELFEHTDQALYRVKEHGRCGCAVYEDI